MLDESLDSYARQAETPLLSAIGQANRTTDDHFTYMMPLEREARRVQVSPFKAIARSLYALRHGSNLPMKRDGITQDVVAVCESLLGNT